MASSDWIAWLIWPPHMRLQFADRVPVQNTIVPGCICVSAPRSIIFPASAYPGMNGHGTGSGCVPARQRNSVPGLMQVYQVSMRTSC